MQLKVLLVSRDKAALEALDATLRRHPGLDVAQRLVVNGHLDPLAGIAAQPDALVLYLGDSAQAELESLAARAADRRPPLIVVGSAADTNVMRLAMQAGARDLLPMPLVEADLLAALGRIERDRRAASAPREGSMVAFMNAKGGCGATLLACNVAHMLAAASRQRTTLIDLDLQFGSAPLYFDAFPKHGLLQALENIQDLDQAALDNYAVKHASGLRILGPAADDPISMQSPDPKAVQRLLTIAADMSERLVLDLPRRIDPITTLALERASYIVVVVQQSLTVIRDAKRLLNGMRLELGLPKDRILTVVNRYERSAAITTDDVRTTLGCDELVLVPNAFRVVSECIETGTPLFTRARGAAITQAVMSLETRLGGNSATERPNLIARTLAGFATRHS